MFGRWIDTQRHSRVELGDEFIKFLVARPETFVPAEAHLLRWTMPIPSQQWRQSGLSSMSQRRLALRAHVAHLKATRTRRS